MRKRGVLANPFTLITLAVMFSLITVAYFATMQPTIDYSSYSPFNNQNQQNNQPASYSNNGICDMGQGENCLNAPSDCVCKYNQVCSPSRQNSDSQGCYVVMCGDGYIDTGETSETCCKDAGCSGTLVCDANLMRCVKPQCPYECCENDYTYQDKACPQYYACNNVMYKCEAIDSDNDALADYLEVQKGTDIYTPDTDGDTVLDGYDAHPLSLYINRTVSYGWNYKYHLDWLSTKFYFSNSISEDVIYSYEVMPKTNIINRQDVHLQHIADVLNKLATEHGYGKADKLMMVIAFSRSFVYDSDKLVWSETATSIPDWANFPMETIIKKNGLCADSAVMASSLLRKMGYAAVYLGSNTCRHAIVGVADTEGFTLKGTERYAMYNGKKYYYIDATSMDKSGNILYSTTSFADFGTTFCQYNDFTVYESPG
jgi:hypothetical protein